MVCKVITSIRTPVASPAKRRSSSTNRAAKKVLQKATKSAISKDMKRRMVHREFESLRSLIPSVATPKSIDVSPLEVVLKAIDYIQQLEKQVLLGDFVETKAWTIISEEEYPPRKFIQLVYLSFMQNNKPPRNKELFVTTIISIRPRCLFNLAVSCLFRSVFPIINLLAVYLRFRRHHLQRWTFK